MRLTPSCLRPARWSGAYMAIEFKREGLEQRFRFEPTAVADPRDVQRVDRELAARRTRYMKELRPAILALEKRISDIADARGQSQRAHASTAQCRRRRPSVRDSRRHHESVATAKLGGCLLFSTLHL